MTVDWPLEYLAKDGRTIRVRHVAYGDARTLHHGILQVAYEGTHVGVEPEGVGDLPAVIQRIRSYLTTPRKAQLVAELDGQVMGAISIRPGPFGAKDRHWCGLGMWLVPAARGVGVGSALLNGALAYARSEGFEKVVVEVFSSNQPAIALYRKFGFMLEGRQKKLFVLPGIGYVDNILMGLDLQG